MTDRVNPTLDGGASSRQTAAAIRFAGGSDPGWVVPAADDPGTIATDDPDIDETALNAFAETSSSTSLDVEIDAGQGYVGGAWLARDVATTVSLDASTTGQTVYAGWDVEASNTVLVGLASAFNGDDPKAPLWAFDTDADGVTSVTDERNLDDYRISVDDLQFGGVGSMYGDGSDGAITRSSDGDDSGIINATTYTVEAGVTRTGTMIVHATEKIEIHGTLDASGRGGSGGSGGGGGFRGTSSSVHGEDGSPGNTGVVGDVSGGDGSGGAGGAGGVDREDGNPGENGSPNSSAAGGGGGGSGDPNDSTQGTGGDGGAGANGQTRGFNETQLKALRQYLTPPYDEYYKLTAAAGSGGAGGGGGGGGAGSESQDGAGGNGGSGGDGGNGGGFVVLVAPEISVSGQIHVSGGDGNNGTDGYDTTDTNCAGGGGGGGGGGGDGGLISLVSPSIDDTEATIALTGGTAGTGGAGGIGDYKNGGPGGDGANGIDGLIVRVTV